MTVKIEDVPLKDSRSEAGWEDFLVGLRDLEAGQSFWFPVFTSQYRTVMCAAKTLLNRSFISRKDGDGYRIGRLK